MSTDRPARDVSFSINYQEIKDFLRRLADDTEFRARLQQDPRATLSEYRIEISDEALPEEITLPDEQATRELLARIEEKYESQPEAAAYVLGYKVLIHVLSPAPGPPPPPSY